MSMIRKTILFLVFSVVVATGVYGCGTASNNDQGTSFLAFGWFFDGDGETGASGLIVKLASDQADFDTGSADGTSPFDGRDAVIFMGLQNNLSTQFIRVVRVDCDYDVPGASPSLHIPSDSFATGTVLGAVGEADGGDGGAQTSSIAAQQYVQMQVVSPDIYSFLNVNRNSLPELPFRMNATCRAVGVTQAGDTLTTNSINLFIQFVEQAECCTGANSEVPGEPGGFQNEEGDTIDFTNAGDGTDTGAATSDSTETSNSTAGAGSSTGSNTGTGNSAGGVTTGTFAAG